MYFALFKIKLSAFIGYEHGERKREKNRWGREREMVCKCGCAME